MVAMSGLAASAAREVELLVGGGWLEVVHGWLVGWWLVGVMLREV